MLFFFFFFSRNWTKCLGQDLEVGIRNADLKTIFFRQVFQENIKNYILPNTFKIDTTTSFFQKVIYARPYQKCLGNQARLQRDQRGVVFVHCRYYNEGTMLFLFGLTTIHRQVNFIYTANTKIHKRKLKSTYCVSETRNVAAALHMHRILI